jgi:hypothetical protein
VRTDEILVTHVENLSFTDLLNFATNIVDVALPVSSDIIKFKTFDLHIVPVATSECDSLHLTGVPHISRASGCKGCADQLRVSFG